MLKKEIFSILGDLNDHNRDKDKLLEFYIKKRLNKSLNSYYDQLISNYNAIMDCYKMNLKNIKKITNI